MNTQPATIVMHHAYSDGGYGIKIRWSKIKGEFKTLDDAYLRIIASHNRTAKNIPELRLARI